MRAEILGFNFFLLVVVGCKGGMFRFVPVLQDGVHFAVPEKFLSDIMFTTYFDLFFGSVLSCCIILLYVAIYFHSFME